MRNRRNSYTTVLFFCLFVILQACAGLTPGEHAVIRGRPPDAAYFFEKLDETVAETGVTEASDFRVPNFPYLRTNRFLAATKDRLENQNQFNTWLNWMVRLDQKGRRKEILNLPQSGLNALKTDLGGFEDRQELLALLAKQSKRLLEADRQQPGFHETVTSAVDVPHEYSTPMRIFGLYVIVAIPVSIATQSAYGEFRQWHSQSLEDLEVLGNLTAYTPATEVDTQRSVAELFASARINALGVVELRPQEVEILAHAFAPAISQDVVADYDRFGAVEWIDGKVSINQEKPTVYFYVTYSTLNHQPVLQLNYAFWYSARSGEKSPRIEKGPLDGVTIRISLDNTGRPVMVDVMNNCGCYYFSVPRREMVTKIHPSRNTLYPFVPTWMPEAFPRRPLGFRINSGWHQIEHVYTAAIAERGPEYRLVSYDALESLPHPDKSRESVFTPNGIMKGSKRIEPYIFFSMGIPKVGYMRQRNHHATKLVGRSHFTDTDIYDRYFTFE